MKKAIITGATGFLGYALLKELVSNGYYVCVLCRENSKQRVRLNGIDNIAIIEYDLSRSDELVLNGRYDVFFHLAWEGERDNYEAQFRNIAYVEKCLRLAFITGCKRFIGMGSQAEYGEVPCETVITEDTPLNPTTGYGVCKVVAYYISRYLAMRLPIEHTWVRPFSVYGSHDNQNSLLPQLVTELIAGRNFALKTDGSHIWNYLHEKDAARALRRIGECEVSDTVFNLAGNECLPLLRFVDRMRLAVNPNTAVSYGTEKCNVNLNVSIEKIKRLTGWRPEMDFKKENLIW